MISKEDLPKKVDEWIKRCESTINEWLDDCKLWYDMVAGEQWSIEEEAAMKDLNRPIMTFNRLGTFIDVVSGLEINDRREAEYYPREMGDIGPNQVLTEAARNLRDNCDAEDEESDAFVDLLISGMGWTETRIDTEMNPEGDLVIERVDPVEMRWDISAKKRNLSDTQYVIHLKRYKKDDAENKWPELVSGMDDPELTGRPHDAQNNYKYKTTQADQSIEQENTVIIAHVQWKDSQKFFRVATPQGLRDVTSEEWDVLKQKFPFKAVPFTKTFIRRAFVANNQVLGEIEDLTPQGSFTFKCMTGKRYKSKNTWYGVVKPMVDPQKWSNKLSSTIIQDVAVNGKGLMAEHDAFMDWNEAQENWTDPSKIVKLRSGAIQNGKIQPKPQGTYPVGIDTLLNQSITAFRDTTGINLELMGLTEAQQPGVLEAHRKQAGMSVLSWCFDSKRRYHKEQSRLVAFYIQNYLSDGRLIRVVGQNGAQYIPLVRDPKFIKYDVILEESAKSFDQKEKTWGVMQTLLPNVLPMGIPFPIEALDYLPIPEKLANSWKMQINGNNQQVQQLQQQIQQMQQVIQQLQSPMMEAQTQNEFAKVVETQSKTALNVAKVQDMGSPVTHMERIADINEKAVRTGSMLSGEAKNERSS